MGAHKTRLIISLIMFFILAMLVFFDNQMLSNRELARAREHTEWIQIESPPGSYQICYRYQGTSEIKCMDKL